jgi:hypothetical protein
MPFLANTYRIVFAGNLAGGEVWNTGFWMAGTAPSSNAAAATAAQDAWNAFVGASGTHGFRALATMGWANTTSVSKVTCYSYVAGGTAVSFEGIYSTTALIGTGGPTSPDQTTLVLTLLTPDAGRRSRGRMYLPCNRASLDANGLISSTDVGSVVSAFGADFTAYNATRGSDSAIVYSRKGGAISTITSVRADLRPDIQRRRANRQTTGTPVSATVTP